MAKKWTVSVVSHTHWDREWYEPFQQFRMRLVRLIDKLLDIMNSDAEYRFFNFDGQTVVLEDYLEVRPEREEELRRLISEGRVTVGPWYILPDEFLISAESHIRNLLVGGEIARRFGRQAQVGYLPDCFGHISQMPQILRSCGIESAIIWRGITSEKTEILWEAPDGSRVLAYVFPDGMGYGAPAEIPPNIRQAMKKIDPLLDYLKKHSTTNLLLLTNGMDHLEPQPWLPRILKSLNERYRQVKFVHDTYENFMRRLKERVGELEVRKGEFRDTCRVSGALWKYILPGVLSSRIYLKQMNDLCSRELEGYAERLGSVASVLGRKPETHFYRIAWKTLLKNHAHDSICGCSVDEVHREMETRFASAYQVASKLTSESAEFIASLVRLNGEHKRVVFNPSARVRSEVVEGYVEVPARSGREAPRGVIVRDERGREVASQLLSISRHSYLWETMGVRFLFFAEEVPGLGYRSYTVEVLKRPVHPKETLLTSRNSAENEYLKLSICPDGSLTILDKRSGQEYTELNVFLDGGDVGDEYTYSPPAADREIVSTGCEWDTCVVEDGECRVKFLVEGELLLPESASWDYSGRSGRLLRCAVRSYIALSRGKARVDIETVFENRAKDHRLRVLFPLGAKVRYSEAEGHFDVLRRSVEVKHPEENWIEDAPTFHPQTGFVSIAEGERGLTVANRGLPEYEILHEDTVALTLLRAVGHLAKPSQRIADRAGPPVETPDAQVLRTLRFHYSIIPHSGRWLESRSFLEAHNFRLPFICVGTDGRGNEDPARGFIEIEPEEVVLSALVPHEGFLVLRVWNIAEKRVQGGVRFGFDCRAVYRSDPSGDPRGGNLLEGRSFSFVLKRRQIQSFRIDLE